MFGFFGRKKKVHRKGTAARGAAVPLEEQVGILQECGIAMLPGFTVDDLLDSWSQEAFEKEPFRSIWEEEKATESYYGLSNDVIKKGVNSSTGPSNRAV